MLFSSGLGGAWFDWTRVVAALGPQCRSLIVERPGVGEAPPWRPGTTELDQAVDDLITVLDHARVQRALLVGHSMGAWYVEAAARRHPDRVIGLVFVDGSLAPMPDSRTSHRPIPDPHLRRAAAQLAHRFVRATIGWRRLGPVVRLLAEGRAVRATGADHRERCRQIYARQTLWSAVLGEWAAFPRMRAQLVRLRAARPLPRIPVSDVVAVGGPGRPARSIWVRRHRRSIRRLAPRSRTSTVVIQPAPHNVALTHPTVIADAIAKQLSQGPHEHH